MRSSIFLVGAGMLLGSVQGLNILMNNDDGFGSANLREFYRVLKSKGHNVWIVAPAVQRIGPDPIDSHIWYYNGTPAACTFVALDYVLPNFANFTTPDLVVTGPNYGTNLGPFVWTLSGTAGAAYAATSRSIPAIAFSGSNSAMDYRNVTNSTNEYTYIAKLSGNIVDAFVNSSTPGEPVLPLGYGANVNYPRLGANWSSIPILQTRLTGEANTNVALPVESNPGTFTWGNIDPLQAGVNECINGDCSMTGETAAVSDGFVAVSLYTIDYSAPKTERTEEIVDRLPFVQTGRTKKRWSF
ncbi:5'/3'-nucleotidase SurE [Diaporthe helianthi]|uniref:5'/3'-nucleotidase SurE n=1 Tax=Diaporthe helianthi TaxID=158607 RepID=A0A2P5HMF4_DIAHE|nr:5'/3'-nucleotidase SurE [Diaporthe helianthi]